MSEETSKKEAVIDKEKSIIEKAKATTAFSQFGAKQGNIEFALIPWTTDFVNKFKIKYFNNKFYVKKDLPWYEVQEEENVKLLLFEYLGEDRQQEMENKIFTQAKSIGRVYKTDDKPYLLNLRNCRLNLMTKEKVEYTGGEFFIKGVDIKYDPDAYDKLRDEVFTQWLVDQDTRYWWEEVAGRTILNDPKYLGIHVLKGVQGSGKSTMLEDLASFVGPNLTTGLSFEEIETEKFATQIMEGKLLNVSEELPKRPLDENKNLKKISAGNIMKVEEKGKKPYSTNLNITLVAGTNHNIRVNDRHEAIWTRFYMHFMSKTIRHTTKMDVDLKHKLSSEVSRSYFLNLALAGLDRLKKNGKFTESESMKRVKEEQMKINNPILAFLDEKEADVKNEMLLKDYYRKYDKWCLEYKHKPMSLTNFKDEILVLNRNFKIHKATSGNLKGSLIIEKVPTAAEQDKIEKKEQIKKLEFRNEQIMATDTNATITTFNQEKQQLETNNLFDGLFDNDDGGDGNG